MSYFVWFMEAEKGRRLNTCRWMRQLQLPESKFSYLLQDWDQSLIVETPYAKVNETIAKILGIRQSVNSLERTNRKMSAAVSAFWSSQPIPPAEEEGALMVCSADGKGVPIRRQGEASAKQRLKSSLSPEEGREIGAKEGLTGRGSLHGGPL